MIRAHDYQHDSTLRSEEAKARELVMVVREVISPAHFPAMAY